MTSSTRPTESLILLAALALALVVSAIHPWDMFMALIGACCALVFLGRVHDRALDQNRFLSR